MVSRPNCELGSGHSLQPRPYLIARPTADNMSEPMPERNGSLLAAANQEAIYRMAFKKGNMSEPTYRNIHISPHDGKFHVVLEWSDVCALTFTRNSLEDAFAAIRENLSGPRDFQLLPAQGSKPWL